MKKLRVPPEKHSSALARFLALSLGLSFAGLHLPLAAADYTWDGEGADGLWGTGLNWVGDSAPVPSSTTNLIFSGVTNLAVVNNYTNGDDFQDITFDATAGAFTISSSAGQGIDWFGALNNNSANTQTIGFQLYQSASNAINANAGNITLNSAASLYRNGQALTLNAALGKTIQIDSAISDGGGGAGPAIAITGGGSVRFSGSNAFTSGIVIKSGSAVAVGSNVQLPFFGTGTVRIGDSATGADAAMVLSNWTTGTNAILVDGGSGARSIVGNWGIAGQIPILTGTVTLNNNLTLAATGDGGLRINGVITDGASSFGLVIDNAGSATGSPIRLNNNSNAFDGGVAIVRGNLEQNGAANALGTGTITIGGTSGSSNATLTAAGSGFTTTNPITIAAGSSGTKTIQSTTGNAITYSGAVALNSSLSLATGSTGSLTLSGSVIGGSGTNTVTNSGTSTGGVTISGPISNGSGTVGVVQNSATSLLTLSGSNSLTGGIAIQSGTLKVSNASALGGVSNTVTLGSGANNATLDVAGATTTGTNQSVVVAGGAGTRTITSSAGTGVLQAVITLNKDLNAYASSGAAIRLGNNSTVGGIIGSGNITITSQNAGTVRLGGTNTGYTGTTTVLSGILELQGGSSNSLGSGQLILGDTSGSANVSLMGAQNGVAANAGGILVRSGGSGTVTIGNNGGQAMTVNNTVTLQKDLTIGYTATNVIRFGNAGSPATAITGTGNVSIVMSGAASSSGVQFGDGVNSSIGGVNNAGTITISGTNISPVSWMANAASIGANVTGIIQNSASSRLEINNTNASFTGGVVINTGTVRLATTDTTLNSNNTVSIASGAGLLLDNVSATIGGLNDIAGAGGVVTSSTTSSIGKMLNLNGSGTYSFSGSIINGGTNARALAKGGSGSQTLAGNNTYTGTTSVTGGTLNLTGTLNGTSGITTSGTGGFTESSTGLIAGASTNFTQGSTGTSILSGSNSYGGITTISAGTLKLGNLYALGTSTLGASSTFTGTLDFNGFAVTNAIADKALSGGTLTNTGAAVDLTGMGNLNATAARSFFMDGTGDMSFGQAIGSTNTYSITKNGSNTVTLTGTSANNLATLTVTGGTAVLAKSGTGSIRATTDVLINGGTVKLDPTQGVVTGGNTWGGQINATVTLNSGVFDLNGSSGQNSRIQQLVSTSGSTAGIVTNSSTTPAVLEFSARDTNTTREFDGTIQDGAGTVALNFQTAGTQGSGRVNYLTGNNSYSGGTIINHSTVKMGNNNALGAGPVTVGAGTGGTLDLNGFTLANLVVNGGNGGTWTNTSDSPGTVSTGFNPVHANSVNVSDFAISGSAGAINWNGDIYRTASVGTVHKTGINAVTFGGYVNNMNLDLAAGTTTVSGTFGGSVSATVASGAALNVTGKFDGIDTTTVTGTANFLNGSTYKFDIYTNNLNDRLAGAGTVSLAGTFAFELGSADASAGNVWQIVNPTLTTTYALGFNVSGFTESNNLWTMTNGSNQWTFDEGSGQLSVLVVPEPATGLMLVGGLGMLMAFRRRRSA